MQAVIHIDRLRFSASLKSLRKYLVTFLLALGIVVVIAAIAANRLSSSRRSPEPMPNPNGYDEIVLAGVAISSNFWGYDQMTDVQLRTTLLTNVVAIARGHEALKLKFRVRLHFRPGTNDVDEEMAPYNLFYAFAAEGKLAERENRPQDAVNYYLDAARLGNQCSRGGLVADGLQGIGIELHSAYSLQKLTVKLDSKSCAEIIDALETLDSQRESITDYEREEKNLFDQNAKGVGGKLAEYYVQFWFRDSRKKAETTYLKRQTEIRKNIIAIAAHAYKLDKGSAPRNIRDLIPDYLKAIPKNPTNGTDMTLVP